MPSNDLKPLGGVGPTRPFTPDLAQDYGKPRIDRSGWVAACLARQKGKGALQSGPGAFCCLGAAQAAFGSVSAPGRRLVGTDLTSCEQHVVDRIGIEPGSAAERLLIHVNDNSNDWAPVVRVIAGLPTRRLSGGSDLAGADLAGSDLRRASLRHANLTDADLTDADLTDADLVGAGLAGADLTGADLVGAGLRRADLRRADLRHANLAGADLADANLTGADLTDANLAGADLTDANLTGADLTDANLAGADLTGADLAGADLAGADLTGAVR